MKYFILLFSFISISVYSATCQYYLVNNPSSKYNSMAELCAAWDGSSPVANPSGGFMCSASQQPIGSSGDCSDCVPDASYVYSGSVTIRGWANDDEYLTLTDQAAQKFEGTTICADKCIYKYDFLGDGVGNIETGPITFSGRYTETAQSCTVTTTGPVATISGSQGGGSNNQDVVDSIDNQTSQINDGFTGLKDSITSSITDAATNITNSINSLSAAITDALGITNGKLDSVKEAIDSQTSTLGSKIDSASNLASNNASSIKNSIDNASNLASSNANSIKNSIDSASAIASSNSASLKNSVDQNTNAVIAGNNSINNSLSSLGGKVDNTNSLLGSVDSTLNEISSKLDNIFSDEGADQIEQLGKPTNDSRYTSALDGATNDFNDLANLLVFQNRACIPDFQIDIPIAGSINIPLSEWCGLMALVKLFLHLSVLIYCMKMIQRTVSEL